MSSPSCCQSGCSGSEGALAHLAAQSRQLALPYDHHACIKIESQSSRCECTNTEQHVWIEVVEMQPYSTTWSFPATQWRYCWLREVYKSIKTFHFSLSTGSHEGGDAICPKCTYRNGISRKSSIASDIPMSKMLLSESRESAPKVCMSSNWRDREDLSWYLWDVAQATTLRLSPRI